MEKQDAQEHGVANDGSSKNHDQLRKELSELILSCYREIENDSISKLVANYEVLSPDESKFVLESGKKSLRPGKRLSGVYLRTAPFVYLLTRNEFSKWLSILSEVSELGIFCAEGFLNSSEILVEKGGFELLKKWTVLGLSLGKEDKAIAMAYFEHSAKVLLSTDIERFRILVSCGKKLGLLDVRVCNAYFENMFEIKDLFLSADFGYFCSILGKLLQKNWKLAVQILGESKDVFSSVPLSQTKKVLHSMDMLSGYDGHISMALFRNITRSIVIFDDNSFERWTKLALNIAEIDDGAAIAFLDKSIEVLEFINIEEFEEWISKGSEKLSSDQEAFRKLIYGICMGFSEYAGRMQERDRSYLIDIGIRLASVNPDSTESFFKYAPQVYTILSQESFNEWLSIGELIAKESATFASGFYRNSLFVFKKIPLSEHGKILGILSMLLSKEWLLAGAFIDNLPDAIEKLEIGEIRKWALIGLKIDSLDKRMAVDYFSYSHQLMSDLDIDEIEEWAMNGLRFSEDDPVAGRLYFSLGSKASNDFIVELTGSVALKKVSGVLRYYGLGLSGVEFNIRSRKELSIPDGINNLNPVVSGRTIYLEPKISGYGDFADNFSIYKMSIMHEVGHVLFSSGKIHYDGFSGLLEKFMKSYPDQEYASIYSDVQDEMMAVTNIIGLFPNPILAANMFGLLEDARVEFTIMKQYRGVRPELQRVRHEMRLKRSIPKGNLENFMDALLWITAEQELVFELEQRYENILNKARKLLHNKLFRSESSTLDSLEITFDLYAMLDELSGPLEKREYESLVNLGYRGIGLNSCCSGDSLQARSVDRLVDSFVPETENVLIKEKEQLVENEKNDEKEEVKAAYAIENNWRVLGIQRYDEWDFRINDYRPAWCTVHEIEPVGATQDYYLDTIERHGNEIALIERIFGILKPVDFRKLKRQTDGTEIDIDHFIDSLIEKKCGINPDDRFYIKRDKQKRDVATLFLLDVSASTSKKLADGRTIIQVEKDALIIMIHALESIGDKYAISAFSGHRRGGVEYFNIKDFREEMSDTIARRISILEPVSNTRLGAAIRHSIGKLDDVDASTKMIILLSDGEPYDTCQGEGAYQGRLAEEDTRKAIQELNAKGMHLFCITVESNPGEYIDRIFSNVGYTIIDDARMLPEVLSLLYKKITT